MSTARLAHKEVREWIAAICVQLNARERDRPSERAQFAAVREQLDCLDQLSEEGEIRAIYLQASESALQRARKLYDRSELDDLQQAMKQIEIAAAHLTIAETAGRRARAMKECLVRGLRAQEA
jgi:hypothetical protein